MEAAGGRSWSGPDRFHGWGWLCIASNGPRIYRCRLWERINRRNLLHRALTNANDDFGFLAGTVGPGRDYPLVRSDRLREDVSIRPPVAADDGAAAGAEILVIGFALALLSNHGTARP